ncbi:hypothetical protein D3C87_1472680 [compost metagenome]
MGNHAQRSAGCIDHYAVQRVVTGKGAHRIQLIAMQSRLLGMRRVGLTDIQPVRWQRKVLGDLDSYPVDIDIDGGGCFHSIFHALHADPASAIA